MSILPPPPGAKADLTTPTAGNGEVNAEAVQPQEQAAALDSAQLFESFRSALQGLVNDAGSAAHRADAAKTLDATAELKGNVYPLMVRTVDVLGRQLINIMENVMIPGIVQAMLPHMLGHVLPDMVAQVLDEMSPSDRLTPEFADEIKGVVEELVALASRETTLPAELKTRVDELLLSVEEAIMDDADDDDPDGEEDPEGGELEPSPPMPVLEAS